MIRALLAVDGGLIKESVTEAIRDFVVAAKSVHMPLIIDLRYNYGGSLPIAEEFL